MPQNIAMQNTRRNNEALNQEKSTDDLPDLAHLVFLPCRDSRMRPQQTGSIDETQTLLNFFENERDYFHKGGLL
jgi:hypothetical protein